MIKRDWGLLGYYHKNLLYGGGVVFSVLVVIVMLLASLVELSSFIDEKKSDFHHIKTEIVVEIETRKMAMLRSVIAAEALWGRHHSPRFNLELWKDGVESEKKVVPAILTQKPKSGDDRNEKYLYIMDELAYLANSSFLQYGSALSSYVFSENLDFVGVMLPSHSEASMDKQQQRSIMRQVAKMQKEQGRLEGVREPRHIEWLSPTTSLLTGEKSFQMAASAFHDGRTFLSIVSDLPTVYIERLLEQGGERSGEFFIVNGMGHVILGEGEHSSRKTERFAFVNDEKQGDEWLDKYFMNNYGVFYMDGLFYFHSRLSGTNMSLLHVFSWSDILRSIKNKLIIYWLSAIFWIVMLWMFFLYFNTRVFRPIYKKSQKVFDSENLSRTIIAMAPYGLGLFALNERRMLLENGLMRKYRDAMLVDTHENCSLTDLFCDLHQRNMSSGESLENSRVSEEVLVAINGVMADLSVTLSVTNYQKKTVLLCGVADITAYKQIERKINEARAAAENANQAKSSFLAAMSHEIRTPLNAILGNLEILGRSHLSQSQHIRLKTIFSSSNSLLTLLNDILDFSKIESNEMSLEIEDFDIRKSVHQVVGIYKPLALDRGIGFYLNIDESLPAAYSGDPVRIKQILNNLLSNAVKFTEKGYIKVDVIEVLGRLCIEVADTGIGIHGSQQHLIFDSFKQANSEVFQKFGGTGLGLTLCKRMANLMGGDISFSSTLSQGSIFRLTLPLDKPLKSLSSVSTEDAAEVLVDMQQRIRVLVVDDHPANRILLQDQLEILGCIVDAVDNGEMALRELGKNEYHVVFTDLQMPVMNGYELSFKINRLEKRVPVIAVTSHTSEEDRRKCREYGIVEILFKPASLLDISKTIMRNIDTEHGFKSHVATHEPHRTQDFKNVLKEASFLSIENIRQALTQENIDKVMKELHFMKGSFAMAGFSKIVDHLNRLEDVLHKGGARALSQELADLEMRLKDL